nr:peptide-methionine (R)-S-oxide reductase MsrB [Oceanipulchritudo coccoides]
MKRNNPLGKSLIPGLILLTAILYPLFLFSNTAHDKPMEEKPSAPEEVSAPEKLEESDWKERLTPEQYRILRQAGTERPNGDVYHQFKDQGAGKYFCAGCGTMLFSSEHKFDSRCGWPSFWDPAAIDSIETRTDMSLGMKRVEVVCANCKGHLGHLFEGEGFDTPTDQRFCINGTVLTFVPDEK